MRCIRKQLLEYFFYQTDYDALKRDQKLYSKIHQFVQMSVRIFIYTSARINICFIFYFTSFMISSIYMQIAQSGHEAIKRCNDTTLSNTISSM